MTKRYRHELAGILVCLLLGTGCAGWIGQRWSEDYTRLSGTRASSAKFIDGDLNTGAPLTFRFDPLQAVSYPTAEAEITLPQPRSIRRLLNHSDSLRDFQIWAYESVQEKWFPVYESKGRSDGHPRDLRTPL